MKEKHIRSELIYEGKILNLRKDYIITSQGIEATREIIEHKPAVVILPVLENGNLLLIKQFRKPIERVAIEVPAGVINEQEDPKKAANRELAEETGFASNHIINIGGAYPIIGYGEEFLYYYLATDLYPKSLKPDIDEVIETMEISLEDLIKKIDLAEIQDGKTIQAVYFYLNFLKKHK